MMMPKRYFYKDVPRWIRWLFGFGRIIYSAIFRERIFCFEA